MSENYSRTHRFRKLLPLPAAPGGGIGARLEANARDESSGMPDIERVTNTAGQLREIVKHYFDDDPMLRELVSQLVADGEEGLALLRAGKDEELARREKALAGLEAIVLTDGSRPSFLVRNGTVDLESSPAGNWRAAIGGSADLLEQALPAVGRVNRADAPQGFEGTAFLVAPSLVMTNRHVLQGIADPMGDGQWAFRAGVNLDFGHEFLGTASVKPRQFRSVRFASARYVDPNRPPDHGALDLVLIELEAAASEQVPLAIEASTDWAAPGLVTYLVGYPGNPNLAYPFSLLEKLFQQSFGYKRLAPGEVMLPTVPVADWTVSHDATTLGGNSGSAVLVAGRETVAAALHYGGQPGVNATNWGHVLGRTLDIAGAQGRTVREVLLEHGAKLVKRNTG